ncbi:GNAT family N-acetyltransferase [Streptomyces sp. XM83C]|uniref:GNAT family N-acetyltransferase n=1 Tax=Streptomyces sp. XM83C TaxID=2929781 RepID=UPI001FF82D5C|nr:GNAT family N-acetyltransferase [Streptomyces sp. XM83C]MCK1819649.1 GNAT family N-acetyltransferase [Streptomyces sp. XM83C]
MSITIRPYDEADAHDIAELYNRHRDNPNPVVGGITGDELRRELAERDTGTFLVAVDDGRVVGTFGLFHNTGRRSARAGELIADMFFVAPAYRNGVITGRLFTEAVEWMVRSGCLVLRLTVNPANTVAFRLYRRVGCVSVGQTVPGEDGNVELHNYIPLILRSVFHDLGPEVKAALGGLNSFATVTESRDDELRSDVRVVDGVRTVDYCLAVGEFRLTASVDVDRGAVRQARITGPDGDSRELRVAEPPYRIRAHRRPEPHRFTSGALTVEVDGDEGTVRVLGDGHHGPLFVSTWPSCRADRPAGWREGDPRDLRFAPVPGGVRITERCGDDEITGTVTLDEGALCQEFAFTRRPGRLFQTVGLRQGTLALDGEQPVPLGLGLGVRDASEVVAAARVLPAGSAPAWTGAEWTVRMPVTAPARLIHSGLLERGLEPGPDGTARLRTEFHRRTAAAAGATPAVRPLDGARRVQLDATAAGVTSWKEGTAKVLRSPHPRVRAFGNNPRWSAGLWVTAEPARHSRATGLGWGVRSTGDWEPKQPFGLYEPQQGIAWELDAPDDTAAPVRVVVSSPAGGEGEEAVLWLTPNTGRRTTLAVDSAGTRWELDSGDFRQIWASAAAVRLADGSWLTCRPEHPAGDAEIVLRTTPSGLLVGCAAPAGGEAAWRLTVGDGPGV